MYCHEDLYMRSLARYFGAYFIILSWQHACMSIFTWANVFHAAGACWHCYAQTLLNQKVPTQMVYEAVNDNLNYLFIHEIFMSGISHVVFRRKTPHRYWSLMKLHHNLLSQDELVIAFAIRWITLHGQIWHIILQTRYVLVVLNIECIPLR